MNRFHQQPQQQAGMSRAEATALSQMEVRIMSALSDLQAQVAQNTDAEQSAVTLIQGLADQLAKAVASDDSAALQQLSDQLSASVAPLAAAIVASTPVSSPAAEAVAATPVADAAPAKAVDTGTAAK
jgi:hypothetical protein